MAGEFKIKTGLIINDSSAIYGISDSSLFTNLDTSILVNPKAIVNYLTPRLDSKGDKSYLSIIDGSIKVLDASIQRIDASLNNTIDIYEILDGSIKSIDASIQRIDTSLNDIYNSLDILDASIQRIDSDVFTINSSIVIIDSDIFTINSSIVIIDSELVNIDSSIQRIDSDIFTINSSIQRIDVSLNDTIDIYDILDASLISKVSKSGDTMTGILIFDSSSGFTLDGITISKIDTSTEGLSDLSNAIPTSSTIISANYIKNSSLGNQFYYDVSGYIDVSVNSILSSLSFINGLHVLSEGSIGLGGVFIEDVSLDGSNGNFSFTIDNMNGISINDSQGKSLYLYSNNGGIFLDDNEDRIAINDSNDSGDGILIKSNSGNGIYIEDSSQGGINVISNGGGIYINDSCINGGINISNVNSTLQLADDNKLIDNKDIPTGLVYDNDYSATYTERSLVDKAFVINTINSSTSFADNGLYKIDNSIRLGGKLIKDTSIDLNDNILSISNNNEFFNIGTGFDYNVLDFLIQSDNKILIVGEFSSFDGSAAGSIIRLNSDGTKDSSFLTGVGFGPGFSRQEVLAIQTDGKILVGGQVGSYYKTITSANGIIRLNSDGNVDSSFNVGTGFDSQVYTIEIQQDNKILVGGNFVTYNDSSANHIIRLNSDGTVDSSFNVGIGFGGLVTIIKIQTDGKILVGGGFTSYDGSTYNRIIRLNSDGTVDPSFNIGTGFDSQLDSLCIQADNKILVGGSFSTYDGSSYRSIIRLNSDGTVDPSFNIGTGFEIFTSVYSLNVQSDGKILVGGGFTSYDGITANYIIRLNSDGTIDSNNIFKDGFDNNVFCLRIQSDGKIIIGGGFTLYDGSTANYIVRLDPKGNIDSLTKFSINFGSKVVNYENDYSAYYTNRSLVDKEYVDTHKDSSLSDKVNKSGDTMTGILTFDSSGFTLDGVTISNIDTFIEGLSDSNTAIPTSSAILANNYVKNSSLGNQFYYDNSGYLDVSIISYNNLSFENGIFKIDNSVGLGGGFLRDVSIDFNNKNLIFYSNTGTFKIIECFNSTINSLFIKNDGKILVGGAFSYNSLKNFIQLTDSGSYDYYNFLMGDGFNGDIDCIAVQSDDKILLGGLFTSYDNSLYNYIIRLESNGNKDTTFNIGSGFNNQVYSIAVQSDNKILVGGNFTLYNEISYNYIIRLNSDGNVDSSFNIGAGFNNTVYSIAVQSDNKILVGGGFYTYDGSNNNYIIRLNSDGTVDSSFNVGAGFDNEVYSITLQSDNKILVGGNFTSYDTSSFNRIIRLNSDGTIDSSFNIGSGFNGQIYSITVQSDNKILVGGNFTLYDGSTANYIVRLNSDGTVDSSFNIGSGFDGQINSIAVQSDGKILVGGGFYTYNNVSYRFIIRLNSDGTSDSGNFSGTNNSLYFNNSYINSNSFYIQPDSDGNNYFNFYSSQIPGTNRIELYTYNPISYGESYLNIKDSGKIELGFNNNFLIYDSSTTPVGLQYSADYSATFVNRSLVDKGYVDSHLPIAYSFSSGLKALEDTSVVLGGKLTNNTELVLNDYNFIFKDYDFNVGIGFNSLVEIIFQQSNGKLIVSGSFYSYDGVDCNSIIRLNTNGKIDPSFNYGGTGFGYGVYAKSIIEQSDGKLVMVGSFSSYDGSTFNHIIRLNSDGTIDDTFYTGTGFDNSPEVIIKQSDNKLVIGGVFSSYDGSTYNGIIRLNSDGTIDSSFNIGSGVHDVNTGSRIYSIVQDPSDNGLIVVGQFNNFNDVSLKNLVKLKENGTIDSSFSNILLQGKANKIKRQSDGKLVIGGQFSNQIDASHYNKIIRLNQNGIVDNTFNTGWGFDNEIFDLIIQTDNKILVGGYLSLYNNEVSVYNIARLNPNGSLDSSFNLYLEGGIFSLIQQLDNQLVIGGWIYNFQGDPCINTNILRLDENGNIITRELLFNSSTYNFELGGDYSSTFTDRSLVDKGYVINIINSSLNTLDSSLSGKVNKSGDTMTGTLSITSGFLSIGDPSVDGAWRFIVDVSGNLSVQKRISSNWVEKGNFN
ncbi:MAG: hypothetical protein PHF86_00480 [Candidatus Nanoarchaeia archaeon]|nr:hypothetical protein [Candidatus Nanoarchaeia archaeon]